MYQLQGCCWYHKGTNFQANHNQNGAKQRATSVVADTTKVRIFKQITTHLTIFSTTKGLLLIPQRYEFSSKSQHWSWQVVLWRVVADTTKVRIFKQITTVKHGNYFCKSCCWYHKGTNFQANHNGYSDCGQGQSVVADTTKVRIFKQITTRREAFAEWCELLLIPQRYEFSSKSQPNHWKTLWSCRCCWYHKGTNFQANHNKQYTIDTAHWLLLIPQRYEFSSKSQLIRYVWRRSWCCCWYHKGTNFQANHNTEADRSFYDAVVADTTKVRIFKQITT